MTASSTTSQKRRVAQRMLKMYRDSRYTARDRAVDTALLYEPSAPQHAYWRSVVAEIDAIHKKRSAS